MPPRRNNVVAPIVDTGVMLRCLLATALVVAAALLAGCESGERDDSDLGDGQDALGCVAGAKECPTRGNARSNADCLLDQSDCLTRDAEVPRVTPTAFVPTTATAQAQQTTSAAKTPPPVTPRPDLTRTPASGITGIVLIGPTCPVVREGEECPDRPYEAFIGIRDAAGQAIASVASGTDGRFRVELPPGTYTLVARPQTSTPIPGPVEMEVIVEASAFTDIVVSMDSGIR